MLFKWGVGSSFNMGVHVRILSSTSGLDTSSPSPTSSLPACCKCPCKLVYCARTSIIFDNFFSARFSQSNVSKPAFLSSSGLPYTSRLSSVLPSPVAFISANCYSTIAFFSFQNDCNE